MIFDDYQDETATTVVFPADVTKPYLTLGLCGEIGEVAGTVKKYLRGDLEYTEVQDRLLGECGDVLWYIARLLDTFEIPMGECAEANLKKLASRKQRGVLKGDGDNR
jgi:NTP pyrophosphatase (non-canonical NTP hydrolase)